MENQEEYETFEFTVNLGIILLIQEVLKVVNEEEYDLDVVGDFVKIALEGLGAVKDEGAYVN